MKKIPVFLLLLLTANLSAFEIPSLSNKGLGNTVCLSSPDASDIVNTGLDFSSNFYGTEFGYISNYEMSELNEFYFASFYKHKQSSVALGVSQFGDLDFYTETILKLTISQQYKDFQFSVNGSIIKYYFDVSYKSLRTKQFGFSVGYKYKYFILGAVFDNLSSEKLTAQSDSYPKTEQYFLEILSDSRYKTILMYDIKEDFDNRFGFGEQIIISETLSFLFGFHTKPSTIGGGVKIDIGGPVVSYSLQHHPVLGYTTGISLQYSK